MLPILERLLNITLHRCVFVALSLTATAGAVPPGTGSVTLLPPPSALKSAGCEAHVAGDGAVEWVAPCGSPIHTSGGPASGWIETAGSITPYLTDVSAGGELAIRTLVPAGTVAFPADQQLGAGERIRLISLVSPRDERSLRSLFIREATAVTAKPRMPAGAAIALLIDASGRAVAASQPVEVRAGMETRIWPSMTGDGAVFIAWLKRPRTVEREGDDRVALSVVDAAATHPPFASVEAADSLFAAWYGLTGREARLLVESAALRIQRENAPIARGALTIFEEPLLALPTLTVTIAPLSTRTAVAPASMNLAVAQATREDTVLRSQLVEPGKSYALESLPAAPLDVTLRIGDFILRKRVDLSSGTSTVLSIPLEPLIVTGTVYLGDSPTRALVKFQQRFQEQDLPLIAETDARGAYEITLWAANRYVVETAIADHPGIPAFSDLVRISGSGTIDVHVPANALRARIYDAENGKPLDRAEIMMHSRWSADDGAHSAVTTVPAKGELSDLPPLRNGTTEIHVRAAGYDEPSPVLLTIDDTVRERVLDFPMTRSDAIDELTLLLDGVRPASGAEAAAWSGDEILWRGTADESGHMAIPKSVAQSRVVIRHPEAATDVTILGTLAGRQTFTFAPAAPPLLVRIVHQDGSPVRGAAARISLWLTGGVRLTGAEAGFATWSFGATSPDGTFIAKGLHPKPLRLFATTHASAAQIESGTFDGLATTVPFPWPAMAVVPLVDE